METVEHEVRQTSEASRGPGGVSIEMTDNHNFLSHFFSNAKMRFQSFFMLMTNQLLAFASSYNP